MCNSLKSWEIKRRSYKYTLRIYRARVKVLPNHLYARIYFQLKEACLLKHVCEARDTICSKWQRPVKITDSLSSHLLSTLFRFSDFIKCFIKVCWFRRKLKLSAYENIMWVYNRDRNFLVKFHNVYLMKYKILHEYVLYIILRKKRIFVKWYLLNKIIKSHVISFFRFVIFYSDFDAITLNELFI